MDAIRERKYRALEEFTARVRSSPVGDRVARMIPYGSVLRGDAGPESDGDLLIVATGDVRAVWRALGDIAFGNCCLDEYRHPRAVLREVREKGKEGYRVEENTMRHQEALDLPALAQGYLETACALKGGVSLTELSAKGLLLLQEDEWPKTHRGVVPRERADRGTRRRASFPPGTGDWRNRARYDSHVTLTEADADDGIGVAEQLTNLLRREVYAS